MHVKLKNGEFQRRGVHCLDFFVTFLLRIEQSSCLTEGREALNSGTEFVGVEFSNCEGTHDGVFKGTRYNFVTFPAQTVLPAQFYQ